MADVSQELLFLERLFLKVGTVDGDEELEACLITLLPQAIAKLSNPSEQIRNKVVELLTHINKRLKSRSQVQVPLSTLLQLYLDPKSSAFIVNFTVIYIKLGYPRAPAEKRSELLPTLIKAAEARPQHRESLGYIAVSSLDVVKLPGALVDASTFLNLNQAPKVSAFLLTTIHNILLFPYGAKGESDILEISKATYDDLVSNLPQIIKGDVLEQMKVICVKLLCSGVYSDKQSFPSLVIASADTRSSVFSLAENHIRKIQGTMDLDDKEVLAPLYSVYMGTGAKETPTSNTPVSPDKKRGPACVRLRLKLLPFMAKSKLVIWPTAIQVLFDSLYGEITSTKLRHIALNFCLNMLKNMTQVQINQTGEVLLKSGLLQLLSSEWAEPSLLRHVFPCIGLLVSRCQTLATSQLLQSLFTALIKERDRDVGQALRDCLVTMSTVYSSEENWMKELVKEALASRSSLARLTALHYLATSLPASSVYRTYLLLEASNHQDEELCTEAKKALYSGASKESSDKLNPDSLPDFVLLLTLALEKRDKNNATDTRLNAQIVSYLRLCLAKASGCKELRMEPLAHPCKESPQVSEYLRGLHLTHPTLLPEYTNFLLSIVQIDMRVEVLGALIEVLGCHAEVAKPLVEPSLDKFMVELGHNKEDVRRHCARIVGLISNTDTECIEKLMEAAVSCSSSNAAADTDKLHGSLLASAYIYERAVYQPGFRSPSPQLLSNILIGLKKETNIVVGSWSAWLNIVGRTSALPLSSQDTEAIVDALFDVVFSTKFTSKTKDIACTALGMLCVGDENFTHRHKILETFTKKTPEVKDVDLVLSIGEALVCCVLGPASEEACDPWTRQPRSTAYSPEKTANQLIPLLLALLKQTHPNTRQCCCFWMLSMVKHCAHISSVKENLNEIQSAFMELLSDSSSLVQEASSKGLALVYESGAGTLDRGKLVAALVEQLTSGKRGVAQVSSETKLFEEGQLGKTPTGGNLSTYKELCSMASDLNQPDLIYKFMNLANHNALWNSKRGAAFGVGTLADLAGGEMDAHLPKILPKLYRYQYDPTPGIQQTMTSMWSTLTGNTPNVLEKYGIEIYMDLVPSLTAGQYRVRQSACKALSDFIRSAPAQRIIFQDKVELLDEVWTQLLRVMDDVHEATRQAATSTTKTLSRMMVRQCEKSEANKQIVATRVLPILLERGVNSSVSEVRTVSTEALCALMKVGVGEKDVVRLVPALLTASQHLDYSSLSHLSTMVSGNEAAQEVVDSARVSAIKSHFTVQTLTRCVEYIKEPMLAELTPHLVDNLKSSVGLGTRLATCHFLTILSHTMPNDQIQPYIGKYLGALFSGLSDRNGAVRRQYAITVGQLTKYAKDSSIDRLLDKLSKLYFDSEDEGARGAVGVTLQSILNHNQEAVRSRGSMLLPLAFFAKHQIKLKDGSNDKSISLWEEICDDVGGGSAVAMHCTAIANLLVTCLGSTTWHTKAQAGRSVKTLVTKAGDSLSDSSKLLLVNTLVDNLSGRSWEGKESLLHALASLAKYQESGGAWLDVMERECCRGALCYKREAVRALGEALTVLNQRSLQHNKYPALLEINSKLLSHSDKDEDEEDDNKDLRTSVIETSLEALGKAFPSDIDTQERVADEVIGLVNRLDASTRLVQVRILSTVVTSVDRLHPALLSDSHLELCLRSLEYSLGIAKHTSLRKEALNLILVLLQRLDASSVFMKRLKDVFLSFKDDLEQDNSSEVRTRLADIKQALNL